MKPDLEELRRLAEQAKSTTRPDIFLCDPDVILALIADFHEALSERQENQRRIAAARFVAEHWRDSYMEAIVAGDNKFGIGTHPLGLVLDALDGETDPRQLGLPEAADEALAGLLSSSGGDKE